jgi:hypothetical protein
MATTTEAAAQAGVTTATIRTWCRIGAVAAVKVSGRWAIDADSLAHRIALTAKAKPLTAENLAKVGGSRWTKNGMDRLYFNDWAAFAGLTTSTYNTGNIASASYQGEHIANRQANLALGAIDKLWFDLADGQFHCRYGYSEPRFASREQLFRDAVDGIKAAVAAL